MSGSDEDLLKSQFFYNYASETYSLIYQGKNRLYNKIKDLTTITMALIPIILALCYYSLDNLQFNSLLFPIGLTLTCLCLAVLAGFYILWDNKFEYNDPLALIQKYQSKSLSFITLKTASSLADVANINCEEHNKMGDQYQYMILFVGTGIIILLFTFWLAIINTIS